MRWIHLALFAALASCGARTDLGAGDADADRDEDLDPRSARIFIADIFDAQTRGRILAYATFEGSDFAELDAGAKGAVCSPRFDSAGRLIFLERGAKTAQIVRLDLETGEAERSPTFFTSFSLDDVMPDARGGFWATDYAEDRVGYFAAIDAPPVYLGTEGDGVGQFRSPTGVAVTASGKVLIVDGDNRRLVQIDDISGAGWTEHYVDGGLSAPLTGIALDSRGRIIVSDGDGRIHRFDELSRKGYVAYEADTPDTVGETFFNVSVGPDDRIYTTFSGHEGVEIWRMDDLDGSGLVVLDKPDTGMPALACGGFAVR